MALYDVGIVGCWYWGNYGSLLNGYATFSLIKGMGLRPLNIVTPYNGFEPHAKKFFEAVLHLNYRGYTAIASISLLLFCIYYPQ